MIPLAMMHIHHAAHMRKPIYGASVRRDMTDREKLALALKVCMRALGTATTTEGAGFQPSTSTCEQNIHSPWLQVANSVQDCVSLQFEIGYHAHLNFLCARHISAGSYLSIPN
jgi:hypothetical protein